ncbi:MAG: hypothetical protein ACYDHZ_00715 [Dehalococcoidia bacterium]
MRIIRPASLVLPTGWAASTGSATATETVADALLHRSAEFPIQNLANKIVTILATEVVLAGIPGPLNMWVELSPVPTTNNNIWPTPLPTSALYWAAIGGGGGALPPTAPVIEAGTGVNLTPHTILIPWNIHSAWARVVVQTPVVVATAFWVVQVLEAGQ